MEFIQSGSNPEFKIFWYSLWNSVVWTYKSDDSLGQFLLVFGWGAQMTIQILEEMNAFIFFKEDLP